MRQLLLILMAIILFACNNSKKTENSIPNNDLTNMSYQDYEAISWLGDTLRSTAPANELIEKYALKKKAYDENPDDIENIIWYGRFTAYMGNYREAINIYSQAIEKFPDEARFYRHRGHRYITIRESKKAIIDLTRAAFLIEGKENQVEEDGMPNPQNIPVSTLHGNIYYHLGLAYYVDQQMEPALKAYKKCLETSSNPDNVVSATHWIYMIYNRLGRKEAAQNYLRNIKSEMNVIENTAYYRACLFYKGILGRTEIFPASEGDSPSNSALSYAYANWLYYNSHKNQAEPILKEIVSGNNWASFGFIAAESDLAKLY